MSSLPQLPPVDPKRERFLSEVMRRAEREYARVLGTGDRRHVRIWRHGLGRLVTHKDPRNAIAMLLLKWEPVRSRRS